MRHHSSLPLACLVVLLLALGWGTGSSSFAEEVSTPLRERLEQAMAATDSIRRTGDRQGAFEYLESLRQEAVAAGDSIAELDAMRYQAFWWRKLGRVQDAIQRGREAVEYARTLGDSTRMCSELFKLGLAVSDLGHIAAADSYFARVLEVATARGEVPYQARARTAIGRRGVLAGEYEPAMQHLEWAAAMTRRDSMRYDEVMALNLLGLAWSGKGELRRARECFQRCVVISEDLDYPFGMMQGIANLAYLENHVGDPGRAAENYRRSYEMARSLGQLDKTLSIGSIHAGILLQLGRYDEAEALLDSILTRSRSAGLKEMEADARIQTAEALLIRGHPSRAIAHLEESLRIAREIEYVDGESRSLRKLARAYAQTGERQRGLALLLEHEKDMERRATSTQYLPLSLTLCELLLEEGRHREALSRLVTLEARSAEIGQRATRLGSFTAQAKCYLALGMPDSATSVLHVAARIWEEERSLPRDPEWREQRGSLGREIYTDLAYLLTTYPENENAEERVRRAFEVVQRYKARTLWERMMGPAAEVAHDDYRPPDLSTIQRDVMREGEILIDAYLGPTRSLVFAVTSKSCRVVELPDGLSQKLDLYVDLISNRDSDRTQQGIQRASVVLAGLLFEDLSEEIAAAERIFFLPDGWLNHLPLGCLAAAGSSPPSLLSGKEIVRVPSVTILARLRTSTPRERRGAGSDIVAVAGGVNETGEALPGAVGEVRELGRSFHRVAMHVGVLNDMSVLGEGNVLHLAAHSSVDDERPWRSGILLAQSDDGYLTSMSQMVTGTALRGGGGPETRDVRFLHASEIAELDLRAQMAVLSGCESARGRVLSGEGVLGLANAFLSARVAAVVATLWPVDDASTAQFMKFFYDALADGQTIAASLQSAQAGLRSRAQTSHPFHWASFVVIGDGTRTIPLERRGGRDALWVLPVALLLGLGLWIRARRAQRGNATSMATSRS